MNQQQSVITGIHKSSEFVLRKIQDLYFLVPTRSCLKGNVLVLNDVAARIWRALEDSDDYQILLGNLRECYGDAPDLEDDLMWFLDQMEKKGAIHRSLKE